MLAQFKKVHLLEIQLFEEIGLEYGEGLSMFDVPLGDENGNFIHTIVCGDYANPPMLMIHGFGASGIQYYRLMKELKPHYLMYSIDFLGMGSSSRCDFTAENIEDTNKFIVDVIEKWRKAMKLDEFHLVGHSYGGYMAGLYSLAHPSVVKSCLVVSGAGFTKNKESLELRLKRLPYYF